MGVRVTAVEEHAGLATQARAALADMPSVTLVDAPMAEGAKDGTLFDALMFDGSVEQIPAALLHQLRDGARIVGGMRDGAVTRIGRAVKVAGKVAGVDNVALLPFADIECVPLPGFAVRRHFQF